MTIRLVSRALGAVLFASALTLPARADVLCTLVADAADGRILFQQGTRQDCTQRYTPASTFKLPIALMGADAGILQGPHQPVWNYQPAYPDWGGEAWRQPTDPARWIKYSVVWYSQLTARALGQERFQRYTSAFGYGNADVSGEPGKHNGTDGAWIISSLRISPFEQVDFLRKFVNRQLPVKAAAYDLAENLFEVGEADGWRLYGKTGTGSPGSHGVYTPANAYGWFVGWARKDDRQLVFARLLQDEGATQPNAGLRARDGLMRDWAAMVAAPRK
ncbi:MULTISPECIES: OXA-258 family class D beta-lactamase [Achromobacter]|jgi:beta-lactamase class D|uniref:Beta-lactamase n=1 Tax=Achromobacter sp. HNDS-1 TaxID=3151598 RepID=A0AAU7LGH1_9BURK|nr:class D beta-lactamase [Achromobacter ruhlandii]ALX86030.1 class D beta-lactamase [Achromobacter denitrificans]OCZ64465.1 class D beta-lactamase [Achromobacter xylosoxidans]ODA02637.1 class D beta-lactamase [Achromobacter xylosoxidans]CAB3738832.1 Beta-lactamase OXA-18 [Achromobacter ruhlandii]